MNRKAAAFVPFVALIMFIGGIVAVMYYRNEGIQKTMDFGKPQREILEVYAEGESMRQYISYSAKYAAHQAFYSLAHSGGYESVSCPPYIYTDCDINFGSTKADYFSCTPEAPDVRCSTYAVGDMCKTFPCNFEKKVKLYCTEKEEAIYCEIRTGSKVLDKFTCATSEDEKCKSYGATVDSSGEELNLNLNCEQIVEEQECETSACGNIGNYSYWYNGANCVPNEDKIAPLFNKLFEENFDKFLFSYNDMDVTDNALTLYDIVSYNLKIDSANGIIEGVPIKETYEDITEDEDGNILGSEIVEQESILLLTKEIVDPEGVKATVIYEYAINPYFKYQLSFSPTGIFNNVRSKANSALSQISSCSGEIATCATSAETSLANDPDFTWKITGEEVGGSKVIKFDAVPKGFNIYGINGDAEISSVQAVSPIRFAVKYSGSAPQL